MATTLFVEHLTVLDFAYLDPTRGLLGESWICDVELRGELNQQGFVYDFGLVKKELKALIDQTVDHTLLVPAHDKRLWSARKGDRLQLVYDSEQGEISYQAPTQTVTLLPSEKVDFASVTALLESGARQRLPANVKKIGFHFRYQRSEFPFFQYVHGLRLHEGNCQRLAHGHRSILEIRRNGEPDPRLEQKWSQAWDGRFVGTREDCLASSSERFTFGYRSSEGTFQIELPAKCCQMLETQTTIEWIADYFAEQCKTEYPEDAIWVRACEGIHKGAIATR